MTLEDSIQWKSGPLPTSRLLHLELCSATITRQERHIADDEIGHTTLPKRKSGGAAKLDFRPEPVAMCDPRLWMAWRVSEALTVTAEPQCRFYSGKLLHRRKGVYDGAHCDKQTSLGRSHGFYFCVSGHFRIHTLRPQRPSKSTHNGRRSRRWRVQHPSHSPREAIYDSRSCTAYQER